MVCFINANELSKEKEDINREFISNSESCDVGISDIMCELDCYFSGIGWSRYNAIKSLNSIAKSFGFTLYECLDQAISVIEKRKGKIINGAFVKDN